MESNAAGVSQDDPFATELLSPCPGAATSLFSSSSCFLRRSSRSLNRSPKRRKCGRMTTEYLTNSSMQSTSLSRFELAIILLPSESEVNCV